MLTFSIIICTYNRAVLLQETLVSIISSLEEKSNYEILVIDNNSTDNTREIVKYASLTFKIKYFLETNQGLSYARNRGIREATNDIMIFLDDDIHIDSNYFNVCEQAFINTTMNIIGGKVLPYAVEIPEWLPKKYYYLASIFDMGDKLIHVNQLMGANYAMRKEVTIKVGWYDTNLGRKGNLLMGGEENDYLIRSSALGFKILYHPKLIVYHKVGNKLTKDYIFNYAFLNGKSSSVLEYRNLKFKYFLKLIVSSIKLIKYYLRGIFITDSNRRAAFKISQLYALGYIKGNARNN